MFTILSIPNIFRPAWFWWTIQFRNYGSDLNFTVSTSKVFTWLILYSIPIYGITVNKMFSWMESQSPINRLVSSPHRIGQKYIFRKEIKDFFVWQQKYAIFVFFAIFYRVPRVVICFELAHNYKKKYKSINSLLSMNYKIPYMHTYVFFFRAGEKSLSPQRKLHSIMIDKSAPDKKSSILFVK